MGKQSKYESNVLPYLDNISGWIKEGYFLKDVAKMLKVGVSTLRKYATEHKELKQIIDYDMQYANALVTNAIFKSAVGYTEQIVKPVKLKKGGNEEIVEVKETVYVPPDIKAAALWAHNRNPEKWSKKEESRVEIAGTLNLSLEEKLKEITGEKY